MSIKRRPIQRRMACKEIRRMLIRLDAKLGMKKGFHLHLYETAATYELANAIILKARKENV